MNRLAGRDPLSIAPGGIGTGAAQVYEFPITDPMAKIAQMLALNKAKKAQAKQKLSEEYKSKIGTLAKELDGWQDRDKEILTKLSDGIIDEAARIFSKGVNPFDLPDFNKQTQTALQLAKKSKEDETFYNNTLKTIEDRTKLDQYSGADLDDFMGMVKQFAETPLTERNQFILPLEGKAEKPINWMTSLDSMIKNTQQDEKLWELEGMQTETKEIPESRKKLRIKTWLSTPEGKAAKKELNMNEDEMAEYISPMFGSSRKDKPTDRGGGISFNFGSGRGVVGNIKVLYAPEGFDLSAFAPSTDKELPVSSKNLTDGLLFRPDKEGDDIGFEEIAVSDNRSIPFKATALVRDKHGNFFVTGKTIEMVEAVNENTGVVTFKKPEREIMIAVSGNNKTEIEDRYLGGKDIEEVFNEFKTQYKPKGKAKTDVEVKEETSNKFDKYKRK